MGKITLKRFDLILILIVSAGIVGISVFVYSGNTRPVAVTVKTDEGVIMYSALSVIGSKNSLIYEANMRSIVKNQG